MYVLMEVEGTFTKPVETSGLHLWRASEQDDPSEFMGKIVLPPKSMVKKIQ